MLARYMTDFKSKLACVICPNLKLARKLSQVCRAIACPSPLLKLVRQPFLENLERPEPIKKPWSLLLKPLPDMLMGCSCMTTCGTYRAQIECTVQVRERDWANVITAHAGDPVAYTWRLQKFSIGEHALRPLGSAKRGPDCLPPSPVTAVAVSACGNFGLVGTASGRIDRHNMQSGLHRGAYSR